jgi:hypothetical protein
MGQVDTVSMSAVTAAFSESSHRGLHAHAQFVERSMAGVYQANAVEPRARCETSDRRQDGNTSLGGCDGVEGGKAGIKAADPPQRGATQFRLQLSDRHHVRAPAAAPDHALALELA